MVKAIPQIVDGVWFRSRTEARWATFFRLAGVPYQYEPEGFQLGTDWYVPDFLLPTCPAYVEVKPVEPDEREIRVARALAATSRVPVLMAIGNPCQEGRHLWVDVTGGLARCCIVAEYNAIGVWVTDRADGGEWAVPLGQALKNCSTTGETHPALVEAGLVQFRKPAVDLGVNQARRDVVSLQNAIAGIMAKLNAIDREPDSA